MHKRWLSKPFSKTQWLSVLLVFLLGVGLTGCGNRANFPSFSSSRPEVRSQPARIKEVAPPALIRDLRQDLEAYQPQVQILSPRPDEVLQTQTATVLFSVQDLPLFKDADLGLGPHLHVFVDDQPYQAVYDPAEPLVLEGLSPGTHTIRAFASRPWHESFKNEGAFAEATFHVFAKTAEKAPSLNAPLLTYSRPQGHYGAEPIMLDFYLTQAPLHAIAQADDKDNILDWKIRCTINGESFDIDEWRPIYLQGFKPGQNWIQLELLDEAGAAIANVFNDTVRIIDYTPNGEDTLSKLTRNEIAIDEARRIVIAEYEPPAPEPEVIPVLEEPAVDDALEFPEEVVPAEDTPIAAPEEPELQETGISPAQGGELTVEDLPVEILAPEAEPGVESALEQQMEDIQDDVVPRGVDAASAADTQEVMESPADTALVDIEDTSEAAEEALPYATSALSAADRSLEPEAIAPVEEPLGAPSEADELPTSTAALPDEIEIRTPLRVTPSASLPADTVQPEAATERSKREVAIAEVKPSPVLNSYEAKAILEELNDLETEMEDLKGAISSATDQPALRDAPSPQIEDLRSQLDQLKTKFGDTWQRLSDFVKLKLQT